MFVDPMIPSEDIYDIVVVGGGMVGATLASVLDSGLGGTIRVLVVEKQPEKALPSTTFDARSIVLSRSTARFLHHYGLWQDIKSITTPIEQIKVQRRGQPGQLLLCAEEAKVPALGYVTGGRDLGHELWSKVLQQKAVSWLNQAKVTHLMPLPEGWQIQVDCGEHCSKLVQARLLVVADGANSSLLPMLGIEVEREDYRQLALVASLQDCSLPWAENLALEKFLPGGDSIAVLPRGQGRAGIVFATQSLFAEQFLALGLEGQQQALANLLDVKPALLGRLDGVTAYPLSASMAKEVIRPNLVVLGNAAQTLHPIAGQGYNLAVRDLACLIQLLQAVDFGCSGLDERQTLSTVLQNYEQMRRSDRQNIQQFCQGLLRLFASDHLGISFFRQLGLVLFDTMPEAKAWLSTQVLAPRVGSGYALME